MFFPIKGGLYKASALALNVRRISTVNNINKISVPFCSASAKGTYKRNIGEVQTHFVASPGQFVSKNQLLGEIICDGVSFPQYSGISGKVKRTKPIILQNGCAVSAMDIEAEGTPTEKLLPCAEIKDYASLCDALKDYSVITPDIYFSLISSEKAPTVLVVNCLNSDMLSEEQSRIFVDNIKEIFSFTGKLASACGMKKAVIVADNRAKKLYLQAVTNGDIKPVKGVSVRFGNPKYPTLPSRIINSLYGTKLPVNSSGLEKGYLVLNCSVLYHLSKAVENGTPCTSAIITVAGDATPVAGNFCVPVGTNAVALLEAIGSNPGGICKTVYGGSLSGNAVYRDDIPIEKDTGSLFFFGSKETSIYPEHPKCYRCGRCIEVCPVGLLPVKIAENFISGRYSENIELNIDRCINCGCCAYICCGKVPLTQYISASKGRLKHNG